MTKYSILDSISMFTSVLGRKLNIDEVTLTLAYDKESKNAQSPIFIIFSVIGGILTVLLFLFFIYIAKLNDSAISCLILGLAMVAGCAYLSMRSDSIFLESTASACLLGGLFLIGLGMNDLKLHHYIITSIIIIVSIGMAIIVKDFSVLLFIFLVIVACLVYFVIDIFKNNALFILMAIFPLLFSRTIHKESQWIVKYKHRRNMLEAMIYTFFIASIISFIFYCFETSWEHPQLFIISSKILILLSIVSFYIWSSRFLNNHSLRVIYSITLALVLISFYNYPIVPGFIMLILHCFYSKRYWLLLLSSIGLVFSLSHYYYTLEWTLLNKSLVLIASGMIFLFAFLLHNKFFNYAEKS